MKTLAYSLKAGLTALLLLSGSTVLAGEAEEQLEEIVVIGTQIKGARITEALPVTVVTAADIEALGVNSGDELLEFLTEQGQNYFSESENISGGVNSARGDIGAFNLRNLGTGNTLVLLNGRRIVNSAAYQTEEVGGSFVPVNTANVQSIPVTGLRRLEVLKDGASAIYGADAVAGVLNYVLKSDFEGLRVGIRADTYDGLPRNDLRLQLEWGDSFNEGRTYVGASINYFKRDRVNSQDDPRWANSDFRSRVPAPFDEDTTFRNNSPNSAYGQYDIRSSVSSLGLSDLTDSSGEFETFPTGHENCEFQINDQVCGAPDGNGTFRYNLNENRDLYSELDRLNFYAYLNHEFSDSLEFFGELTWYYSDTNTIRHPSTPLSAVAKHRIAADAYYNPFGPCGSPNRLPESVIGTDVPCSGLELELDNYRFAQVPRIVDVDGDTYRLVAGLRGTVGNWDWEGALTWSKAERKDVTHNRISNSLMQIALSDPTPAGFNPFSPTLEGSNIQSTLIDVTRINEQELLMLDFRMSRLDLFELPGGAAGLVAGVEFRDESFSDDRDPRLDGTITYTDHRGTTYPFISDVINSSPTPDNSGERQVVSLFGELSLPILENLDMQLALRYENFDDVGSTTVGKVAAGYRVIEPVLLRASWSQAFRAPNLITINETQVARSNTRNDFACFFVDPDQDTLECRYGMQRTAQGSRSLEPETSDNYSFGFVLEPFEPLTITLDWWGIEKEDTIGLFGEENHIALDLLMRLEAGNSNCASFVGNPSVVRDPTSIDEEGQALFDAAGICAAGQVLRVNDTYVNLDNRTVEGHDLGIYWDDSYDWGDLSVRLVATWLDKYEQQTGGDAQQLVDAKAEGRLPDSVPVVGVANLIGVNGRPERKDSLRVRWSRDPWALAVTRLYYDAFIQQLSNGDDFPVDSMTTYNLAVDYKFRIAGMDSRIRLGVNNLADERAPIADDSFGYFADQHRDLGRYYYIDLLFRAL